MMIGEKVQALREARGWNYKQVAEAVRALGADNVRYQHIQQLELYPSRVPRYLPELAKAFGMTVEQFQDWTPSRGGKGAKPVVEVREEVPAYGNDLAEDVRQITMALVVLGDWLRTTRPTEAPLLHEGLSAAVKRLGVDPQSSILGMVAQSLHGKPVAATRAARTPGPRSVPK